MYKQKYIRDKAAPNIDVLRTIFSDNFMSMSETNTLDDDKSIKIRKD
jgi:hypothetical protein